MLLILYLPTQTDKSGKAKDFPKPHSLIRKKSFMTVTHIIWMRLKRVSSTRIEQNMKRNDDNHIAEEYHLGHIFPQFLSLGLN